MTEFLSPVIARQLPQFVQDDYPAFAKFIKDFFAFLEQDQGFLRFLEDWKANREPSTNAEPYISKTLADLGFNLSQDLTVSKSVWLSVLRDFYLARGTPQSFEILWKALFNDWVKIEYPRDRLFVTSAANYAVTYYVFLSSTSVGTAAYTYLLNNIGSFAGTLVGSSSKVTASVESVLPILSNSKIYLQVEILKPIGEFHPNELVELSLNGTTIVETIFNVLDIKMVSGTKGSRYLPGDRVLISGAGIAGTAEVGKTQLGSVTNVNIINGTSGYRVGNIILARTKNGKGSGFSAQVSSVNGSGAITGVSISSPGTNFDRLPDLFPLHSEFSIINNDPGMAVLQAVSSNSTAHDLDIGAINKIKFNAPYVDFDPAKITIQVESLNGSGVTFPPASILQKTIFKTKGFKDQRGFLELNCNLQDSYQYQQFSYSIRTPVNPVLYDSIVADMLHPVGYVRTSIIDIDTELQLSSVVSNQEILHIVGIDYSGTSWDDALAETFEIERHSVDTQFNLAVRQMNNYKNAPFWATTTIFAGTTSRNGLPNWDWNGRIHQGTLITWPTVVASLGPNSYIPEALDFNGVDVLGTSNAYGGPGGASADVKQDKYLPAMALQGGTAGFSVTNMSYSFLASAYEGAEAVANMDVIGIISYDTGETMNAGMDIIGGLAFETGGEMNAPTLN